MDTQSLISSLNQSLSSTELKGTGFSEHVLGIIKHYIEEAELADVMEVLLKSLTTMPLLPYNPYPAFIDLLQKKSQQMHVFTRHRPSVVDFLKSQNHVERSSIRSYIHIGSNDLGDRVYGLQNMVSLVNIAAVNYFRVLVDTIKSSVDRNPNLNFQLFVSLCGLFLFAHIVPDARRVLIRQEYVIRTRALEEAVRTFCQCIYDDIIALDKNEDQHFLFLELPNEQGEVEQVSCIWLLMFVVDGV